MTAGKRLTSVEAVFRLYKAGFRAREPYGGYDHDWKVTHVACDRDTTTTLEKAEYVADTARACPLCRVEQKDDRTAQAYADMRAAGVEPDPDVPFPGTGKPWPGTHVECGRAVAPYLKWIRRGVGPCKPCSSARIEREKREKAAAAAVEEALSYGMRPEEPFPGVKANWTATHIECGTTTTTFSLGRARAGLYPCWKCSTENRTQAQLDNKSTKSEKHVVSLGYVPLVPYPGRNKPWSMTHTACGATVAPRYDNLAAGQGGCKHCAGQCPANCQCSVRMGRAA